MCVDFTDLNKACPQDYYPLPEIDWKVESLCGYPFKCFLDAYKGYHQLQLAEPDEEKTTFHTGQGVYCYTKMPFGLKNAGATYQRLMDKAFDSQIGQNIEVYVDDLVVKSYTEAEMLRDIDEMFRTLRKINMKLNPKKCTFVVAEGVFLGYVVTPDGIKLCPDKIATVLQLPSPRTIKEVQSLNGKLASLNRFLSKSAKKPRTSVKGQILADFLIEMPDENPQGAPVADTQQEMWTLFTDSSTTKLKQKEDALSKIASTSFAHLSKQVVVEVLKDKSIKEKEVTNVVEEDELTWMTPIVEYSKEGTLPSDRKEARKVCIKARQYELMEGILYRRSFLTPWLRCVGPLQAEYVIREIHKGSCSMHAGPRSVVAKAIQLGYYWPTMHRDARDMIRKCNNFAMDYFTKWIEAKAVAKITGGQVKKFVWDNIVCRFGFPASVKHPQSNGLVERANQSLGEGNKARLEIGMPTYRTAAIDVVSNDKELRLNLDLLEERRERVAICEAKAKLKMAKYYNA
nr:reverse transcriptase domain-containing protein [Tanacetum cinerariifolium]